MKLKWYICTLILSLALLTVIQQQQSVTPNQEIVLHFQDDTLSISDTKTTLANLKQKLQDIGITSVEIISSKDSVFRILYYSDSNVDSIKNQLLSESLIVYQDDVSNSPSGKQQKQYDFDVFELKKATNSNWDFDGQLVYQFNLKSDRSFQIEDYASLNLPSSFYLITLLKTQYKSNLDIAFVSDNTSHNIPEGRAGPLA